MYGYNAEPPIAIPIYTVLPYCVIFTEVVIHMLIIVSIIIMGTIPSVQYKLHVPKKDYNIMCVGLILIVMVNLCISVSILFISLVILLLFFIKFLGNHSINKTIKNIILKLGFLFVISVLAVTIFVLIFKPLISHPVAVFIFTIFFILLSVSVLILNYPLDTWCCMCFRKSPLRVPLLPINNTEGQRTNPDSVWDHRNVPSYTATNYPNEMTDCETDNVSNLK